MALYEDGTQDCARCLALKRLHPGRVKAGSIVCCTSCELALQLEFAADDKELRDFLWPRREFADWLLAHDRW